MTPKLRRFLDEELTVAQDAERRGDSAGAWNALERAHVLSQAHALAHVNVHARMIGFSLRRRDLGEVIGQLPRLLLAGPASLFGLAPRGNTGGTSVGIFKPVPVPEELQRKLDD